MTDKFGAYAAINKFEPKTITVKAGSEGDAQDLPGVYFDRHSADIEKRFTQL
jgi:hypothetical protein